jgi:AraC-like DNA-binding protein
MDKGRHHRHRWREFQNVPGVPEVTGNARAPIFNGSAEDIGHDAGYFRIRQGFIAGGRPYPSIVVFWFQKGARGYRCDIDRINESRAAVSCRHHDLAAQDTLAASLGRTPTVDELAATLGISRQEVQGALDDASRSVHTLEDTVLELFTDRRSAAEQLPETRLLVDEQVRYLRAAVTHLPERMRHIIEQVFFEGRSITDVATGLGITHSAVSQQKSEALRLLQDGLTTHYSDTSADQSGDSTTVTAPVSRISSKRRTEYLSSLSAFLAAPNDGQGPRKPAERHLLTLVS